MNILEAYQKKLAIAESVYAKEHDNRPLGDMRKVTIARVLANTAEYLNEAFENSVGTQLSNMKTFKKFCLDLTTVALPNLIANELVITYPMKSRTGFVQYLRFVAGSEKGGVEKGELINDVFAQGKMTEARRNYTGATVIETVAKDGEVKWGKADSIGVFNEDGEFIAGSVKKADGTIIELKNVKANDEVTYIYDNVKIPQNDLPILNAEMDGIALHAKARRIAIYYSQMAAFQAKTEMGLDLGEVLASQACAELSYEIDTEVVDTLVGLGKLHGDVVTFNKHLPVGVSMKDHYASIVSTIEEAAQIIYDRTQKHSANYMICSSSIKPILMMSGAFTPVKNAKINGPYFAGEVDNLKVFVSPAMEKDTFIVGFNGDDYVTSAAVLGIYMAVIPTQLLGYADGGMSQGFSSLYDIKPLNKYLVACGKVIDEVVESGATPVIRG